MLVSILADERSSILTLQEVGDMERAHHNLGK